MSDNEGQTKKSGYRLEYASSGRAKCKGGKPCAGTLIPKGALRFGSVVDFRGNTSFVWRHWGCVTPKILSNVKNQFAEADDLDGFEDLKADDQERVRRAWEEGKVADEDIPETARKPAGDDTANDEGEKPKKKRATAKKVAAEGDEEEKPKRKRAPKAKKIDEGVGEAEEEAEEKATKAPVKKSRAKKPISEGEDGAKKKTAPRKQSAKTTKKVAKDDSEASGEDFAEEMAVVEDDEEEEEEDEPARKKRKRPASKQAASAKKPRATSSRAKKSKAVVEEYDDLDDE